ncbi:type II secretion system F family protein [Paraconexibacter antarcticus]|uniref:Type II secretion system F family protein n=1 Tax=Paraconexibacter antarcticus TaxID=2949664 RepID=A0ABY5DQZ5_9ACTN|nr:type II secretion system F family protein [Paraconexibacter antarcticus]UTI63177.1 type II secretion system F family protein [Paraconexibacter antarcticus]
MAALVLALGAAVAAALAGVDLLDARFARAAAAARATTLNPATTDAPGPGTRATRAATALGPRTRRLAAALAAVGRRAGLPVPAPGDLERRVAAAGLPSPVAVADVMAAKAGAAVCAAAGAIVLVLPAAPGRLGPLLTLAAPAAGYLAPDLWLARRARRRATALAADLPDVLDLTRVAVAAGLPVTAALAAVGRRRGGPLAAELHATASLMALGVPRAQALDRLAARCPLPGVLALVAAIRRSDRHGTSLAPALASLAADARADRARAVQDHAARAAPKIQLAVALLLVPAAMLLLAAGLVAGMT